MKICLETGILQLVLSCSLLSTPVHGAQGADPADIHREMGSVEVVIVGGGMAGLSAAARLKQHGIQFIILEARDRLGGRMHTVDAVAGEDGGGVLELGAQWIHGGCQANSLFNYAASRRLLGETVQAETDEGRRGHYFTPKGEVIDEHLMKKVHEVFSEIEDEIFSDFRESKEKDPSVSIRDFYFKRVEEEVAELEDWMKQDAKLVLESLYLMELAAYAGDTPDEASMYLYGSSVELPGGDIIVPDGLKTIISSLESEIVNPALPNSSKIQLNTRVTDIYWNISGAYIKTESGKVYEAEHVIVTLPLGVLQHERDLFHPPLPAKAHCIDNLRPGRVSKIFLEFSKPFWMQGGANINFSWSKKERDEAEPGDWIRSVPMMHKTNGNAKILTMWVMGAGSALVDTLPDHEVLQGAAQLLRQFTGDPTIEVPTRLHRHKWLTDPYARGTWSFPSVDSKYEDYAELMRGEPREEEPRLLLAGEHTHPTYWSFMHGARLAGIEQADKIHKFRASK